MNIAALPGNVRRRARALMEDLRHNGSIDRSERHILVLRHLSEQSDYNDHYLHWLRVNHPRIARRVRLARLLPIPRSLRNVSLLVPWFQDPLRERMPMAFRLATHIEQRCRARSIPVVNPVASLSVSIKSRALAAISGAGVRAAHFLRLEGPAAWATLLRDFPAPFIVREDYGHGGPMHLVTNAEELESVQPASFRHPVAIEYIETRGEDGLWRKRRYVLFGPHGVSRHLIVANHWIARAQSRVDTPAAREEELAFLRHDNPHHDRFDRVRNILGLDVVAFDYAFDRQGELVIWEPNPFPILWGPFNESPGYAYQIPTLNRLYEALTRYLVDEARL